MLKTNNPFTLTALLALAVCVLAVNPASAQTVYLDADFEGCTVCAVDGCADAANLNAGILVGGPWTVANLQESRIMAATPSGDKCFFPDRGRYDFSVPLSAPVILGDATKVVVTYDTTMRRGSTQGSSRDMFVRGKDSLGVIVFEVALIEDTQQLGYRNQANALVPIGAADDFTRVRKSSGANGLTT